MNEEVLYEVMETHIPKDDLDLITVSTRLFKNKEDAMKLFYERAEHMKKWHEKFIKRIHLCVGVDPFATEFEEDVMHFSLDTECHAVEITVNTVGIEKI